MTVGWPASTDELEALQLTLAEMTPHPWRPVADRPVLVAGVFTASATRLVGVGAAGDPLWAGAVAIRTDAPARPTSSAVISGRANGPYIAGLLALREGPQLEQAVRSLGERPDVVLVNGTGRDHPRRAGIAVHLGAVLDTPTVGVTVRPLLAPPVEPGRERGDAAGLVLDGKVVGSCRPDSARRSAGVRPRGVADGRGGCSRRDRLGHRVVSNAGADPPGAADRTRGAGSGRRPRASRRALVNAAP